MATSSQETENKQAEGSFDLFGSFSFKVDAKGRVALPSKFRKVLPKDLVVSLDPTGEFISVFDADGFNAWIETLLRANFGDFNPSSRNQRMYLLALKNNADSVEVDSSGRISLKQEFREKAGIDKDVILVGNTGHLEIWDAASFDAVIDEVDLTALIK